VLTGNADSHGLIAEYLAQDFIRQDEPESGPQIRIIPFHALPRPESTTELRPAGHCLGSERPPQRWSSDRLSQSRTEQLFPSKTYA